MLPVSTSPEPGSPSLVPLPLQSSSPLPPPSPTPPLTLQKPATSSLSSTSTWPHRYIATPSALAGVLQAIRALPEPSPDAVLKRRHIFFDSEGYELGTTVGKLALIQLGLPNPAAERAVDVFLIDVLALSAPDVSPEALRGLWDVLEDNKRVVKIGWDLKQDWAELFHSHGVDLAGVLDLQVAELLGRVRSSDALRVQGKMGAEHRPGWVWSLGGMKRAVDDFQGFAKAERDEAEKLFHSVRARFEAGGSAAWLDRPLTNDLLQYAGLDIFKIAALYPLFHAARPTPVQSSAGRKPPPPSDDPLIDHSTLAEILAVSNRALGVHRPERRRPDDEHHQHAYLPSEVLQPGSGELRAAPCPGCNRTLHESSWQLPQSRVCMVCWAVERRLSKRRGVERGVFSAGPGAPPVRLG